MDFEKKIQFNVNNIALVIITADFADHTGDVILQIQAIDDKDKDPTEGICLSGREAIKIGQAIIDLAMECAPNTFNESLTDTTTCTPYTHAIDCTVPLAPSTA